MLAPFKPIPSAPNPEVTLTFTATEISQLEAVASLHGESVQAFVQRAALEAAKVSSYSAAKKGAKQNTGGADALWLTESLTDISESKATEAADLFAPVADQPDPDVAEPTAPVADRGVVGEPSKLAKGKGLVWEIRRALGRERLHGLGWTREHLAFVLKLSVIGVRKMEHEGITPIKSLHARKTLLDLAKALEKPNEEICAYIEREERALR
jgi:hypothetical protein